MEEDIGDREPSAEGRLLFSVLSKPKDSRRDDVCGANDKRNQ
jgi:hypothetical protein